MSTRSEKEYEKRKKAIHDLSEKEFTELCRKWHAAHERSITDSDDSIPFYEFYSEQCATYGRPEVYN